MLTRFIEKCVWMSDYVVKWESNYIWKFCLTVNLHWKVCLGIKLDGSVKLHWKVCLDAKLNWNARVSDYIDECVWLLERSEKCLCKLVCFEKWVWMSKMCFGCQTMLMVLGLCITGWGCSSVGRASVWYAAEAASIPCCGKGFFFQSHLSVQTLLRCPYTPMCNHMH